jgi:hypothetical protein
MRRSTDRNLVSHAGTLQSMVEGAGMATKQLCGSS